MKVSNILLGLILVAQAAFAQAVDEGMAAIDDHYEPLLLQARYKSAQFKLQRKLAAYSYDEVTDSTQFLPDGNQIKTHTTTTYVRDQEGRMRITYRTRVGAERIAILDPANQAAYLVRPDRKDILRMTGDALVDAPTETKPVAQEPRARTAHMDLGEKLIAGVTATGTRMESTTPAGLEGNDHDIVQTMERWRSRDLAEFVYTRHVSPKVEVVKHVDNLKFTDAPASEFTVPEGYAIRDVVVDNTIAKQ